MPRKREELPQSIEYEKLVLGSILLDAPANLPDALAVIETDDFILEKHRRIWGAILALHEAGEAVDRQTVARYLDAAGQLQSVDGLGYLVSLDEGLPQLYNLDSYVWGIHEYGLMRRAIIAMDATIQQMIVNRDPLALRTAESMLREIIPQTERQTPMRNFGDWLAQYPGGVEEFFAPKRAKGLPTPWPIWNAFYDGLVPGNVDIVAARPGMGKSALALQIGVHHAKRGQVNRREIEERIGKLNRVLNTLCMPFPPLADSGEKEARS